MHSIERNHKLSLHSLIFFLISIGLSNSGRSDVILTLDGRIRDFNSAGSNDPGKPPGHPDFEKNPYINGVVKGLVSQTLGLDKIPTFAGSPGAGNIQDASTFAQWYRDVNGVNLGQPFSINLAGPTLDQLSYTNNNFFPIDKMLLGNQGRSNNFHFTVELAGAFTYHSGRDQKFRFTGDDDVWFYVNDRLAIDLGGVHPPSGQEVLMDVFAPSAGLIDGGTYEYRFFFAERHTFGSNFSIVSSLGVAVPEPVGILLLTPAIAILCCYRAPRVSVCGL